MKPTYTVRVWQEEGWWLARVVEATPEADPTPLNALTQARALSRIGETVRDLVATVLDADEDTFDIMLDYVLPDDLGSLLCEAKAARARLDAAQALWQDRSTVAVHALTRKGYSRRDAATLLGLSHQRVDQLLHQDPVTPVNDVVVVRTPTRGSEAASAPLAGALSRPFFAGTSRRVHEILHAVTKAADSSPPAHDQLVPSRRSS